MKTLNFELQHAGLHNLFPLIPNWAHGSNLSNVFWPHSFLPLVLTPEPLPTALCSFCECCYFFPIPHSLLPLLLLLFLLSPFFKIFTFLTPSNSCHSISQTNLTQLTMSGKWWFELFCVCCCFLFVCLLILVWWNGCYPHLFSYMFSCVLLNVPVSLIVKSSSAFSLLWCSP